MLGDETRKGDKGESSTNEHRNLETPSRTSEEMKEEEKKQERNNLGVYPTLSKDNKVTKEMVATRAQTKESKKVFSAISALNPKTNPSFPIAHARSL